MPTSAAPYDLLPDSPTRPNLSVPNPQSHTTMAAAYHDKEKPVPPPFHRRSSLLEYVAATAPKGGRRGLALPIALGVALFFAFGLVLHQNAEEGGGVPSALHPLLRLQSGSGHEIRTNNRGAPVLNFETSPVPDEWKCNPFYEPGRLLVDLSHPTKNVWRPYDETCPASELFKTVWEEANEPHFKGHKPHRGPLRAHDSTIPNPSSSPGDDLAYPWLINATIVVQGDSIDRLHVADFCNFMKGRIINIHPKHPASPPVYRKEMPTILGADGKETEASKEAKLKRIEDEDEWDAREPSYHYTRPNACDVKEYNLTVMNIFTWGLSDEERFFRDEDFYHGPTTYLQRFKNITLPLLENLARHLNRPQILHPTLIELSSGFWDLRGFTDNDMFAAGISKPYPMDSEVAFGNIGELRERKWVREAGEAMRYIAKTFPGSNGSIRDGPVISWRTLHTPKRNNYVPYSRAFALDQLARKTMHDLRVSSLATHPYGSKLPVKPATKKGAFAGVESIASHASLEEDYGFDERIRVSNIGYLLEGQHNRFMDTLHPYALPGSYLWSDMILYETILLTLLGDHGAHGLIPNRRLTLLTHYSYYSYYPQHALYILYADQPDESAAVSGKLDKEDPAEWPKKEQGRPKPKSTKSRASYGGVPTSRVAAWKDDEKDAGVATDSESETAMDHDNVVLMGSAVLGGGTRVRNTSGDATDGGGSDLDLWV